jgi:hypothetical protein
MLFSNAALRSSVLLLALTFVSCRDEQAGPRPKAPRAPARPSGQLLQTVPQDLTYRARASWAQGAVEYLGAKVWPPAPDGTTHVANFFVFHRPLPEGFGLFMHVVDAQSGQQLGNADHALAVPPKGEGVVQDALSLRVPSNLSLELRLGFFRGNERLPVDEASMQDGEMRVRGPSLGAPPAPLPEYHAVRALGPLRIDGKLDEPAWQRAEAVTLRGSMDGGPVSNRTVARILYDDSFLYVGFECEDPDVWGTFRRRDDPIYNEEAVEIFLDASADLRTYHELEVSPHNVLFDAYFPARRQGMDLSWDSGAESAVQVQGTLDDPSDRDKGWSVELKIPLRSLKDLPPGQRLKGSRWRFNLYRLEHPGRRGVEGQAFSPLFVGDFHHLARFGWLVFE